MQPAAIEPAYYLEPNTDYDRSYFCRRSAGTIVIDLDLDIAFTVL